MGSTSKQEKMISRFRISSDVVLEPSDSLLLASGNEMENLQREKISKCSIILNFQDSESDITSKSIKSRDLEDIYLFLKKHKMMITTSLYPNFISMISGNIMTPLSPATSPIMSSYPQDIDDEYGNLYEPAWPHLVLVYRIAISFFEHPLLDLKVISPHITKYFLMKLLDLFVSSDPRERELLKVLVHRIYGRFDDMRHFIRKSMGDILLQAVYDNRKYNGISEILDIFSSIISGFTVPLREEHLIFFRKVIIPLHKTSFFSGYNSSLTSCVIHYIHKDMGLAGQAILGLLKYWPKVDSVKELLFLNEIDNIVAVASQSELEVIQVPLFKKITACISCPNYHVEERALMLWGNSNLLKLMLKNVDVILPIVFDSLYISNKLYASEATHRLTHGARLFFLSINPHLFIKFEKENWEKNEKYINPKNEVSS